MTPAARTFVINIPLGLGALAALGSVWPAWAQLAYSAGMERASIAVPFSMVVFVGFAAYVTMSQRTPCRARSLAFYLLTGLLAVAAAGVVLQMSMPADTVAPFWLVLLVAGLPVGCFLAAVAVYRLAQPRHEQVP